MGCQWKQSRRACKTPYFNVPKKHPITDARTA